jgi:AcrR family transcriptional regulator
MARNTERRSILADAGIRVLAQEGARGLTHRAVDAEAGTPRGTASNYFPTRDALIQALVDRIAERLTPDPETINAHGTSHATSHGVWSPGRALFAEYLRDVVRRLKQDPQVPLALFELRLEASRRPAVAEALGAWRQKAFQDDISFNDTSGLPGGPTEIALFHYAIDGLMLDHLTTPMDTGLTLDTAIDELVDRLLP